MRFNLYINQVKALEWGLNLKESTVFSFCYEVPSWADKVIIENEVFYFASRKKAVKEIPIVTDKPDTMYRHYKSLEKKGLIRWKKIDGKDCIQLTDKAKEWNSHEGNKSGRSEKLPNELGKTSENGSEKNPTYNNTSIDTNTSDTDAHAREEIDVIIDQIEYEEKKPTNCLNTYEQTYNHLVSHLSENTHLISGVKSQSKYKGLIAPILKDYLIHLQEQGEWFRLQVPRDPGKHQMWVGQILAGVTKWAKYRKNNPKHQKDEPKVPVYKNTEREPRRRISKEAIEKFENSPLTKKLEQLCGRKMRKYYPA